MKSCKQLESEKQTLQEELQQQGQEIETLKASQKQGMDKTLTSKSNYTEDILFEVKRL